ncbi:RhoGAP-domain-containing protein [Sparassis crispa]|uniref:RhoGAP-domain-containing protein n=1 Tax=Sparassis crispa TaxID=139825 RepID=A0A401G8F5_9APHY|nr:RhoGAP-domain-containing protein [Sparassis crispa]GBE78437.1 RhoGAP-domain-containing protein [Sparassis crispa]
MSSSQDNPPSSRSSLDTPQDAIVLFDLHLKFLTESYLTFFQERKKIEETYVEALLKLHTKAKITDTHLDSRVELSTTRAAWVEVRDNVAREADTRMAFLGAITTDIINPLAALRETQDRIRKRIKEDLKDAVNAHTDYAESTLPRLKRTYLKKCQEVEDFKNAAAAVPPVSPTFAPEHHNAPAILKPTTSAPSKTSQGPPTRPIVTAPQPLRPLDRRPSTSAASSRARSPSTSTALQDLAHSGKRQLNQLITFLDKGGNAKETLGRSDNALRSVRAKREADEADKEYRKAVHWLETLRLRRIKLLEAGYTSLKSFVRESAETVKSVLWRYTDNLIATAATQSQICEHGRRSIERISSQTDDAIIAAHIPQLIAAASPKPIYYHNYAVGECKDLVFGVSLVDYATARNLSEGEVPKIVRMSIKEIEKRGLEAEGIYRVSGRHAAVQELQHKIERNEALFSFNPTVDDVYAVSSLLKLYLRGLPEPVFKFSLQDRIQHSEDMEEHLFNNFMLLRSKMRRLPAIHQGTLKMIVEHLARVASHSDKNKMDAKNLAIVFSAVIFGEDEMPKGGDLLNVQSWKDTLMEDLITHAQILFRLSDSPPLPPAPLGESPAQVSYGSTHTKVANMPPPPSPKDRSTWTVRSVSVPRLPPLFDDVPPEDFTPQLPPRPAGSIHPSLRAGPLLPPVRQAVALSARSALLFNDEVVVSVPPPSLTSMNEEEDTAPSSLPPPWSDSASISTSTGTSTIMDSRENFERTMPDIPTFNIAEPREDDPERPASSSSAATFESAMSSSLPPPTLITASSTTSRSDLPVLSAVKSDDHDTLELPQDP